MSKFVTSQPEKQTIAIDILLNISRGTGNHTMKFGKLIEYNTRQEIYFLKNHIQNVVEKLFPDPFLKNQKYSFGECCNFELDLLFIS